MSLDLSIRAMRPTQVFDANITHNLAKMAHECGLYEPMWGANDAVAGTLIEPLSLGIATLVLEPERFRKFNPENGWGSYEDLLRLAREFLAACIANPDGIVGVFK